MKKRYAHGGGHPALRRLQRLRHRLQDRERAPERRLPRLDGAGDERDVSRPRARDALRALQPVQRRPPAWRPARPARRTWRRAASSRWTGAKCTGCKACIAACPYGARYVHPEGHVDKCTFCLHRVTQGQAAGLRRDLPDAARSPSATSSDPGEPGRAARRAPQAQGAAAGAGDRAERLLPDLGAMGAAMQRDPNKFWNPYLAGVALGLVLAIDVPRDGQRPRRVGRAPCAWASPRSPDRPGARRERRPPLAPGRGGRAPELARVRAPGRASSAGSSAAYTSGRPEARGAEGPAHLHRRAASRSPSPAACSWAWPREDHARLRLRPGALGRRAPLGGRLGLHVLGLRRRLRARLLRQEGVAMIFPIFPSARARARRSPSLSGFGFGFVLERAGFGRAQKLVGQFYGYDMSVFKVMFTRRSSPRCWSSSWLSRRGPHRLQAHRRSRDERDLPRALHRGRARSWAWASSCPATAPARPTWRWRPARSTASSPSLGTIVGQVIWAELEWRPGFARVPQQRPPRAASTSGSCSTCPTGRARHRRHGRRPPWPPAASSAPRSWSGCFAAKADPLATAIPGGRPRRFVVARPGLGGARRRRHARAPHRFASRALEAARDLARADLARRVFDAPWAVRVLDLRPLAELRREAGARAGVRPRRGPAEAPPRGGERRRARLVLVGAEDLAAVPPAAAGYPGKLATLQGGWKAWEAYALTQPAAPGARRGARGASRPTGSARGSSRP